MTRKASPQEWPSAMEPLDEAVDHVRGPAGGRLIVEYGDYECPYSRQAFRAIERVEAELAGGVRFAFRHFPLTGIHPHALAAAAAAEAAARQSRFWDMHRLLFHSQKALGDPDLRRYADELGLDVAVFDGDRAGDAVLARVRRDVARCRALPPCSSTVWCTGRPRRGHPAGGTGPLSAIRSGTGRSARPGRIQTVRGSRMITIARLPRAEPCASVGSVYGCLAG